MFIKTTLISLVSILLLAIFGFESFYYYKINTIHPKKITSQITYSQITKDALWVSLGETENIQVESFSATEFLIRFLTGSIFNDFNEFNKNFPQGISLSNLVAREIAFRKGRIPLRGHMNTLILSIWVSNNYTTEEAINFILNEMHLGYGTYGLTQAAKFYFTKNINNLSYSEKVTLIGLSYAPTYFSPYCHASRLTSKSAAIDMKLKKFNPLAYSYITYELPTFNTSNQVKCK